MLAVARADGDGPVCAHQPRDADAYCGPGLPHKDRQPNIGSLLKDKAGYEVVWKGKWHLSYAANAAMGNGGDDWGPADIAAMERNWGWSGWNPPDAGNAIQEWQSTPFGKFDGLRTLGGGVPNNDGRFVAGPDPDDRGQTAGVGGESVVEFLKNRARQTATSRSACSYRWSTRTTSASIRGSRMKPSAWVQAGYRREEFANLGITLPRNYADDLSTKPKIQKRARDAYNKFAPLNGARAQRGLRELLRLSAHRGRQAHHDGARHAGRNRADRTTPSSCGSPIMAKAASPTACARRPIPSMRR